MNNSFKKKDKLFISFSVFNLKTFVYNLNHIYFLLFVGRRNTKMNHSEWINVCVCVCVCVCVYIKLIFWEASLNYSGFISFVFVQILFINFGKIYLYFLEIISIFYLLTIYLRIYFIYICIYINIHIRVRFSWGNYYLIISNN